MTPIPRDPLPDSSLALLADGYTFMAKRRRRLGSDTFATRLMLRNALCILGEDAAEFFYGGDRFTRTGAMPPTTMRLLQDKVSVQQLDGLAHRHRKQMFMSLMTPGSIQKLVHAMVDQWHSRIRSGSGSGTAARATSSRREVVTSRPVTGALANGPRSNS